MATLENPHKGIEMAVKERPGGPGNPRLPLPGDPVEQEIRDALGTMLRQLVIDPPGSQVIPSLQRCSFQVAMPQPGFEITVAGSMTGEVLSLPVTLDAAWHMSNANGEIVSPGSSFAAEVDEPGEGRVQILFFPQVVQERKGIGENISFTLHASVRLTAIHPLAGTAITEPGAGRFAMPAVSIEVPVDLRVPSILALFRHRGFATTQSTKKGYAIVFAPPESGLASVAELAMDGKAGDLLDRVGVIRSAIEALPVSDQSLLSTFAGNLEGFLDGLSLLVLNLSNYSPMQTGAGDKPPLALVLKGCEGNLQMKELLRGGPNEVWEGNEVGSLIFIGVGETVRLYKGRYFAAGDGSLQIETGEQMCAVVERLDRAKQVTDGGDAGIRSPQPGRFALGGDMFTDTLASFHFGSKPPE